jgi:hypothetical protein
MNGFRGGVSAPGRPLLPSQVARGKSTPDNDRQLYQARVAGFVNSVMDVTAQATISADRRYVRLSVTPVFYGLTGVQSTALPVTRNPVIPGFVLPGGPRLVP